MTLIPSPKAFLIDAGHEDDGFSRNTDHDTPLMLAAACGQVDVGIMLIARFPQCVPYININGMDTVSSALSNTLEPANNPD